MMVTITGRMKKESDGDDSAKHDADDNDDHDDDAHDDGKIIASMVKKMVNQNDDVDDGLPAMMLMTET